jgi:hypothetical protein
VKSGGNNWKTVKDKLLQAKLLRQKWAVSQNMTHANGTLALFAGVCR